MEPYKERMVDEYKNLRDKIDKLNKWIEEEEYVVEGSVSDYHYRLMMIQYHAMCSYEGALRFRLIDLGIEV